MCRRRYCDTNPNTTPKSLPTLRITRHPLHTLEGFISSYSLSITETTHPLTHTHISTQTSLTDREHLLTQCSLTFSTVSKILSNGGLKLATTCQGEAVNSNVTVLTFDRHYGHFWPFGLFFFFLFLFIRPSFWLC